MHDKKIHLTRLAKPQKKNPIKPLWVKSQNKIKLLTLVEGRGHQSKAVN